MKTKRLFSLAMLGLAVSASAQNFSGNEQISAVKQEKTVNLLLNSKTTSLKMTSSPNGVETRANGVSYRRPEGTFWLGPNKEGQGYSQSILHVPAWTNLTFENLSDSPSTTTWMINNKPVDASLVVDNNLLISYPAALQEGSMFYMPVLGSGSNTFALGASNKSGNGVMTDANTSTTLSTTEIGPFSLGNRDPETGEETYLWGSDVKDGGVTMSKAFIECEKPAAPLCMTNIFYPIVSVSGNMLPEGTKMTLRILNVIKNEDGTSFPGDEVLFEMKAGSEDIAQLLEFSSGEILYTLSFSNKVYNPITDTMDDELFVIDQAFYLELSGFDQPNVDLGLPGMATTNEENTNSYMLFPNQPDKLYRYTGLNSPVFMTAFFNVIQVMGPSEFQIPSEGGAGIAIENNNEINAASVFTTLEWSDENFWFEEEVPEWLTVAYSDEYLESDGCYVLQFKADAISPGEGRSCRLTLKSFGSVANKQFAIAQGNHTGISTTEVNAVKAVRNGNNFELTYANDVTSVEVMNAAGQLVANYNLNGTSFVMPAANLANGLYILKFNGEKPATVKIVK